MLVEGGEEDSQEEKVAGVGDEAESLEFKTLQIPCNSFKGLTSNKSFKVLGNFGGRQVVILMDTGSN